MNKNIRLIYTYMYRKSKVRSVLQTIIYFDDLAAFWDERFNINESNRFFDAEYFLEKYSIKDR